MQTQNESVTRRQQVLIDAQQTMWPTAKPREQAIPLSSNIINVQTRVKPPTPRRLPVKYKQACK